MSTAPHGILFRVFEGSDCEYRYVAGAPLSTDAIVWGTHLYNVRVKWRPMNLLTVLTQIAKRQQRRDDRGAAA